MPGFDNSSNLLYVNVYGDISGDYINVGTKLKVDGETDISNLTVKGSSTFKKNIIVEKDITIEGNFTVKGTDTYIHTTNTDICDNIITLNKGATNSSGDSGIIINRGDASNVFMGWKDDRFILGKTNADGSTVTISTIDPANLYVKDVSMNKLDVSGNIYVKGDIIPSENSSNIGTEDKYYEKTYTKSLYVEKNSIFFKQQSSNVSDASCVKISVSNDELYLTRPNKGINKLGMDEDYVFGIPPKPTNPTNDIAGTLIKLNWTPIEQKMSSWGTKLPFIDRIAIDISGGTGENSYTNWTRIKEITGNDDISFTFFIKTDYNVNNENHRIIKDTSYNFRVYGENSLTTEQTAKYLLFTGLSTLPIGPPNDPSFVSFTNITQTSVQLNATAPTDNDIYMEGDQTEPAIEKYKISYNATSAPQRYGEIYTGSHINNFETGDDNNAIDISNLYPGTTYDISFAAKNDENEDYGEFSDISDVTTLIPSPLNPFNSSTNILLDGSTYNLLSASNPSLVNGVFKHSEKNSKTAFSNTIVRLNKDDKIGISCENIVSTFTLSVSKTGSDISSVNNILGFIEGSWSMPPFGGVNDAPWKKAMYLAFNGHSSEEAGASGGFANVNNGANIVAYGAGTEGLLYGQNPGGSNKITFFISNGTDASGATAGQLIGVSYHWLAQDLKDQDAYVVYDYNGNNSYSWVSGLGYPALITWTAAVEGHNVSDNNAVLDVSFAKLTITNTVDAGTDASSGFYINGTIKLDIDIEDASDGEEYTVTLSSTSEGIGEQIRTFYVDDLFNDPEIANIVMNTPVIDASSTYFGITSVDTATITIDASINNFANYFVNTNNRIAEMKLTIGNNLNSSFNTYNGGTNPGEINITNYRQYTKGSSSTYLDKITGQVRGLSIISTTATFTDSSTNELIYSDPNNNPGTNIMKPGAEQFPSDDYTDTYTNHTADISDNQLMYVNGKWRSGNDSIAFLDYSTTMSNNGKDYTSKADSGDNIDVDGINYKYKWVVYKFANPLSSSAQNLIITLSGISLDTAPSYTLAYIIEYDTNGTKITPWRNMKIAFSPTSQAWDPSSDTDGVGGAFDLNSGQTNVYIVKSTSSTIYIRVGLPAASDITFGNLSIT